MKKYVFALSILLNILFGIILLSNWIDSKSNKSLQEFLNFDRYKIENSNLGLFIDSNTYKILFIGNSITANWINLNPDFFYRNRFINRGVGGQTSSQILLRFQQDVTKLGAHKVILNVGINDIGEGNSFYDEDFTLQNIKSMIDICHSNNIELVLTSILPATEIKKNRFQKIDNVQAKIEELNIKILELSIIHNLKFIDYNSKLRNSDGTFIEMYTFDGIHPNKKGYEIMESLIMESVEK